MSDKARLKIQYDGVETREQVERIERGLRGLATVEVDQIGINEVRVRFDEHETTRAQIEGVIEEAGAGVRAALPEQ